MTPEEAGKILGVPADAPIDAVVSAWETSRDDCQARIEAAPTETVRKVFVNKLAEIDRAVTVLSDPDSAAPAEAPVPEPVAIPEPVARPEHPTTPPSPAAPQPVRQPQRTANPQASDDEESVLVPPTIIRRTLVVLLNFLMQAIIVAMAWLPAMFAIHFLEGFVGAFPAVLIVVGGGLFFLGLSVAPQANWQAGEYWPAYLVSTVVGLAVLAIHLNLGDIIGGLILAPAPLAGSLLFARGERRELGRRGL